MTKRWALEWYSKNSLDGEKRRFMWHECKPLLFQTRQEARVYRDQHYGYIRTRKDLQREPFGWRLPSVKQVRVILEPLQ